ncbi:MAG: septum site-determining protein Ssd [Candidatus Nanopelagicales bacterium]
MSTTWLAREQSTTDAARPLVFTADPVLMEEVLRVGASVGVHLEVLEDVVAVRRRWSTAPLVLVGDDAAPGLAASRPAPRDDVVVLTAASDTGLVWELAAGVRADTVICLPGGADVLIERLGRVDEPLGPRARVAGVVGGRGGAGASSLATAIAAVAARRAHRSLLVDADPLGGGLDLVLGCEEQEGLRWPDLAEARGRVSARALTSLVPRAHGVGVLAWGRGQPSSVPSEAVTSVLDAAARGNDLVVVDLPRAGDAAVTAAASAVEVLLLLIPAELRAVAAAGRVHQRYSDLIADVRVVVRGPSPSGLDAEAIANALGLPLAGSMRADKSLAGSLEHGLVPAARHRGPLASLARRIVNALAGGEARRVA